MYPNRTAAKSATSKPSARLPLTKRLPNCSQLCASLPRHMKQFIRKKCLYLLAQSWECRWGYTTVSHRRGQAPTRGEFCCVVAPSCSPLSFLVKSSTLASPCPFPFGSHLQLCLSCNPICFPLSTPHTTEQHFIKTHF